MLLDVFLVLARMECVLIFHPTIVTILPLFAIALSHVGASLETVMSIMLQIIPDLDVAQLVSELEFSI